MKDCYKVTLRDEPRSLFTLSIALGYKKLFFREADHNITRNALTENKIQIR